MRWVKFKDKMPPVGYYSVKSKELRMALWVTETTIKTGYWLTTDFEWLDESPSSDPAEVLVKMLTAIVKWKFATDGRKFDGDHKEVLKQVIDLAETGLSEYEQLKQQ